MREIDDSVFMDVKSKSKQFCNEKYYFNVCWNDYMLELYIIIILHYPMIYKFFHINV